MFISDRLQGIYLTEMWEHWRTYRGGWWCFLISNMRRICSTSDWYFHCKNDVGYSTKSWNKQIYVKICPFFTAPQFLEEHIYILTKQKTVLETADPEELYKGNSYWSADIQDALTGVQEHCTVSLRSHQWCSESQSIPELLSLESESVGFLLESELESDFLFFLDLESESRCTGIEHH